KVLFQFKVTQPDPSIPRAVWVDASHVALYEDGNAFLLDTATLGRTPLRLSWRSLSSLRAARLGDYWYVDKPDRLQLIHAVEGEAQPVANGAGLRFDGPNSRGQVLTWPLEGATEMIDTKTGVVRDALDGLVDDSRRRNEYGAIWSPDEKHFAF